MYLYIRYKHLDEKKKLIIYMLYQNTQYNVFHTLYIKFNNKINKCNCKVKKCVHISQINTTSRLNKDNGANYC